MKPMTTACLFVSFCAMVIISNMVPAQAQQKPVLFPAEQFGRAYLVLPQNTMNLENVLGRNSNFERLINYNETDQLRILSNPVGRLDLLVENAGNIGVTTCTASIISERHILTNNHCAPGSRKGIKIKRAQLLMNFYGEDKEHLAKSYRVRLRTLEQDHALDYAIFEVEGNPAARFGKVKLAPRDPEPGESLLIIHHPAGLPKHATRGSCRASAPSAVRDNDILHRCDTLPGSSGSPILASNSGAVIGIHFAGSSFAGPGSYNFGKRLSRIAQKSTIIAALIQKDIAETTRQRREAAEKAARARVAREAALRERVERELRKKMDARLKNVRDAQDALLKSRLARELKQQEDKFKADLAKREAALRARLEEDLRSRLGKELRAKNSAEQARLHRDMENDMRRQFEARLKSANAANEAALRARLDRELRTRLEDRLRSQSAKLRSQSKDEQARLKAQLEQELTRQIEDRFKTENAAQQAAARARLARELKTEMDTKLRAENQARQAQLERDLKARLEEKLKKQMAVREAALRAQLE